MGSKQPVPATIPYSGPVSDGLSPAIEANPVTRGTREDQKDRSLPVYPLQGPVKCLLLGDARVGKTSLLQAFSSSQLAKPEAKYMPTIGVEFAVVYASLEGNSTKAPRYSMQIWDVAGQERYRTITQAYFRGTTIYFLCFDLTNPETLEHIKTQWLPNIPAFSSAARDQGILYCLVGCKADEPNAQLGLGKAVSEELKIPYFETSAATGGNVSEAFLTALRDKFKPNGKLPWEGPSLEDYLRVFDDQDVQALLQSAGFTKPRTGLQLLIAEYAMTHRGYASSSVKYRKGDEQRAESSSSCVPRNTTKWYGIHTEAARYPPLEKVH